jgi:mannose/cellobiose epimerase-like protein (N-acyl-D-glucosamine 2-epimerase family)
MVLLRVCTQMLRQRADPELDAVARRAVDAIMSAHFNPDFELFNELLNHDLSRPGNEYAQLVYTGHCVEVLWMVLDEARRRGDTALRSGGGALPAAHRRRVGRRLRGVFEPAARRAQRLGDRQGALGPGGVLIGTLLLVESGPSGRRRRFPGCIACAIDLLAERP